MKRKRSMRTVGEGFHPSGLGALRFWLKASDIVAADGTTVWTWPDKSGNGYNFTTGGTGCTFKTNIINGKPVFRFSASPLRADSMPSPVNSWTCFIVSKTGAAATNTRILSVDTAANKEIYFNDVVNNQISLFTPVVAMTGTVANTFGVFSLVVNSGTDIDSWWNGAVSVANATSLNGGAATARATLGGNGTDLGGETWVGDIAEVLFYSRVLSASERKQIEQYLGAEYGITVV